MNELSKKPWVRGPFELIQHAHDHLESGADIDRRLALIGFDNAIEVCIDVFLTLHPWLRDGYEIEKETVREARKNYFSKITFLDNYIQEMELALAVPILPIVWFHKLRNELYHSGNGMVPELHVLEGAQSSALLVFSVLFDIDLSGTLDVDVDYQSDPIPDLPYVRPDLEMDFVRVFVDFEKWLRKLVSSELTSIEAHSMRELWLSVHDIVDVPQEWDDDFMSSLRIRNNVAHGRYDAAVGDDIAAAIKQLTRIRSEIEQLTRQHDFNSSIDDS